MFKFCSLIVVLALATGAVRGQDGAEPASAPEPYSYGYETDTHSASEQRDPSGKVTGFYTLQDADGRARRVEYVADESGFRAKVQTNEVGTKSENSADVEMVASPPTEAQYAAYVQQAPSVGYQQGYQQTRYVANSAPVVNQQSRYVASSGVAAAPVASAALGSGFTSATYYRQQQQQQTAKPVLATTGYSSQYTSGQYAPGYAYGYAPSNAFGYGAQYGYNQPGYAAGYSAVAPAGLASGYGSGYYSSYNNHLPSQYYRSIQQQTAIPAGVAGGVANGGSSSYRAVYSSNSVSQAPTAYTVSGPGAFSYTTGTGPITTATRTISSGTPLGSSNYIVLKKKRESEK